MPSRNKPSPSSRLDQPGEHDRIVVDGANDLAEVTILDEDGRPPSAWAPHLLLRRRHDRPIGDGQPPGDTSNIDTVDLTATDVTTTTVTDYSVTHRNLTQSGETSKNVLVTLWTTRYRRERGLHARLKRRFRGTTIDPVFTTSTVTIVDNDGASTIQLSARATSSAKGKHGPRHRHPTGDTRPSRFRDRQHVGRHGHAGSDYTAWPRP
jgi:hypothetical protein